MTPLPQLGPHPTGEVHRGLSFAEYAAIDGLNAHTLIPFTVSARQGAYEAGADTRPTESMRLGEALHRRILEPDLFDASAVVVDEVEIPEELRKKGGYKVRKVGDADTLAIADAANPGKLVITSGIKATVDAMRDAVVAEMGRVPLLRKALTAPGDNELSIVWDDPDFGVRCKARIDRMLAAGLIVDIKTTRNIEPEQFDRDAYRYRYDVQGVWYPRGALMAGLVRHLPAYVLVVIQNEPPFDMWVGEFPQAWTDQAWADACTAVGRWKRWKTTGEAPGVVPNGVRTMIPPRWAINEGQHAPYAMSGGEA